ncbi:ATP synthase F1 subunit delta [Fimbriimonas ginsengisoli]|uniref:ATP synthase subunit delta n=1 Tax=Fimbriimonas ginsengisoli Gsoil 348 TaxID=661478 RepID=A0A068NXQ7_FIMGI|nr:ATP synthase F1 subunit delta [Fimbriimonas ginsengisoli]AIE88117.1 F0F1 ATP synthase subunit delta [Fimbriimonas ginsengisoli Gsoil 348]
MEDTRLGRRYAQALFETARQYDIVASVEDDLTGINSLLENDPEFRGFLFAPYTSRDEKLAILDRLFSDRVTALTLQAVRLMLEKRREHEIPTVRSEFIKLRREHEGVIHVTVTSAEAMETVQRDALISKLSSVLGKRIEADFEIDPLIIGGVRVAYDNYVMDGSVRGALSKLRERLKYDLLKRIS